MAFNDAFKEFPTLQTERLILRQLVSGDAEAYHQELKSALDLPDRPPWSYGFEGRSVDAVGKSIGFSKKAWEKKARVKWGIALRECESVIIGQCEIFDIANQTKAETGYWLGASHQGRGLMAEALDEMVRYVFGFMQMHRIYAKTSPENLPSIALLKKCGFVFEGHLRQDSERDGVWDDSLLFALLKSDIAV